MMKLLATDMHIRNINRKTIRSDTIAILPIASIEDHGPLPIATDFMIAECICRELESRLRDKITLFETIPYTTCVEHSACGTAIGVDFDTFYRYLVQILKSIANIFRGVIIVLTHGGALQCVYAASRYVRISTGKNIVIASVLEIVKNYILRVYGINVDIIHADPIEASILLQCGYSYGIKEVPKDVVLNTIRQGMDMHRIEGVIHPWICLDPAIRDRYVAESVIGSKELGRELIEAIIDTIAKTVQSFF